MSGRSRHSSFVKRIAGCNARNTVSLAVSFGFHLNCVTFHMTMSRHDPKNLGTARGLISFAKQYASTGLCAAGVPVIIQSQSFSPISLFSVFHRLVCAFL